MITIAIDGPCGSGKSSVSEALAKKLGILYLNTGAIYRAIALYMLRNKISSNDIDSITKAMENINVEIKYLNNEQHTILNGEDVSKQLYSMEVSDGSSVFAQFKEVRDKILHIQQNIAKEQSIVMEGRDITSRVLPDAKYKFYIDASPEVRAQRRINDEKIIGKPQLSYEKVLADVIERDERDKNRSIAPLVLVKDAIYINTDDKNIEETVNEILKFIKKNKDKK